MLLGVMALTALNFPASANLTANIFLNGKIFCNFAQNAQILPLQQGTLQGIQGISSQVEDSKAD